jgi:protein involved in polysaccharide export with SLBB domain
MIVSVRAWQIRILRHTGIWCLAVAVLLALPWAAALSQAPSPASLLSSRAELDVAAAEAERAATTGDHAQRAESAMLAAAIRQRLRDGDLHVGDRIIVGYLSDVMHRDTLIVRAERTIEIPGVAAVPVAGLLRSELKDRVSAELLKYVKAQRIEVTPLMQVGVLGAVAKPGFFAFPSDLPLTDAIMGAGGLTPSAALDRATITRQNQLFRSAEETSKAIAGGLTLDQFGLAAGDALVIGERNSFDAARAITLVGTLASVVGIIIAIGQH